MVALLAVFGVVVLSALGGCSEPSNLMVDDPSLTARGPDAGAAADGPASAHLPCDVDTVLRSRCQACHGASPSAGASTSLTTWDDLQRDHDGKKVYELVKARIHDTARPMPPSPALAAADLATLDGWIDGGAKSADVSCATGSDADEPFECEGVKTTLKASSPFVMQPNAALDQYVCFGFDVERSQKQHVVGFSPLVDNKNILHHILVFQAPEAVSSEVAPCDPAKAATWTLMGGWAPGAKNRYLPPEAGFPEEKGTTHYVIQLHYNNARALTGAKDQSGYTLCSTDELRPNDASIIAFGAINLGPKQPIVIPPRKVNHTVTCKYPWMHADVKLFNATPHMHRRGKSLKSETTSGRVLADQPRFDFEAQVGYPVTSEIHRGDVVKTTCVWTNPDDTEVRFGEGTEDEMCFNFVAYYPRIASILSWGQPTALATCDEQ